MAINKQIRHSEFISESKTHMNSKSTPHSTSRTLNHLYLRCQPTGYMFKGDAGKKEQCELLF